MRMPRKLVSVITSASLVLSLIPVSPAAAYADEYEDETVQETPVVSDETVSTGAEEQGIASEAAPEKPVFDEAEVSEPVQDEAVSDEPEVVERLVALQPEPADDGSGAVAPDATEPSESGLDINSLPDWMYEEQADAATPDVEVAEPLTADDKPADIAAAEQKVSQAEQNLANQQAKWDRGSLGFFDSRGSYAASNLITGCTYSSYNKVGDSEDATSLDNMKQALYWIGVGNQLRSSLGLGQFMVTDALMACAQADANYSDTYIGHAMQFNLWENVAWNYGSDPYYQWYDEEKELFDAAYKAITGSSSVPTGADAYYWYQSNRSACEAKLYELNPYDTEVGHYMNVINPNLTLTGFGVTTRGSMYGWITDAQVNHTYSTGSGSAYAQYSLSAYQAAFDSYYNGLKSAIESAEQALSAAKADLEAVKATYKLENATIARISDMVYTGSAMSPSLTITSGSRTLIQSSDYTVSIKNNVKVGTATVTITGVGYYTGTNSTTFKITARPISETTVSPIAKQTYTGEALKPAPEVSYGGETLVAGTDYTLAYASNINAGTATITLTGKGNFGGTKMVTFEIAPAPIASAKVTASNKVYTGQALESAPKVVLGSVTLKAGADYTVKYANNTVVGTATVTVTGKGNYTGTATGTFEVTRAEVKVPVAKTGLTYTGKSQVGVPTGTGYKLTGTAKATNADSYAAVATLVDAKNTQWADGTTAKKSIGWSIARAEISEAEASVATQTYTGKALEPKPTVTFNGATLAEGTDYKLTYASNTNVGTATVTLTGQGNFTGTTAATFAIEPKPISTVTVDAIANQTYTGDALEPEVVAKNGSTKLVGGTDYTVAYTRNTNAGTATATLTGKGNYSGAKTVNFTIVPADISKADVAAMGNYAYTGKAITPSVAVSYDSTPLTEEIDYTAALKNNVNAGTATVTITGKGNYQGTKKATFGIVQSVDMHRLYNPNSGEHFYTASDVERAALVKLGWVYEGVGWKAPVKSDTPVYRLYNKYAGDHHYTTSATERDALVKAGWTYEGIGWYSDDAKSVPLYRQYNPYATTGTHNYTTSLQENDVLVERGWHAEGIGWYGVK